MQTRKGEVTAYLSLVFILLAAFVASMLESASLQNAKNYCRADMNRALECLFAEYQKELLEEYDVFALEGTYETGHYGENLLFDRLAWYGAANMEHSVRRIQFLTDGGGQAFYEQAIFYMEHKYGADRVREYLGETGTWREHEGEMKDYENMEEKTKEELQSLLKENGGTLQEEGNPIGHVDALKKTSFLGLVMPRDRQVSDKRLVLPDMVSHRELNQGYGDFSEAAKTQGAVSSLLFGEYVMEHFAMVTDREKSGVLDYQAEYILEGKASDRENLEAVARKLLLLRLVSDYGYLQTDGKKKAEAAALAATLCSLLAVPAVIEAATQALLFAWAYGEAVTDVRSLLAGNRVPLVKTAESWKLQLSEVLKLGSREDARDGGDAEGGLYYREYLRMLLFLERREEASMRALDLIEESLKKEKGQAYFQADHCISKIELLSTRLFRRGVSYEFPAYFGYR